MIGVDMSPPRVVSIAFVARHASMLAAALALSMGVSPGTAAAQDALKVPAPPPPDKLNLGLPAARQAYAPDPAESFMQTWNAYYRSEDGHHVFANVAVSHLGLGSTCGLNLAVTTPDGRTLLETEAPLVP